jgi:hypothetical protein
MLSEALQRNAKHEASLSNIPDFSPYVPFRRNDQRLKAWPRGPGPLRYSFTSFRMTGLG